MNLSAEEQQAVAEFKASPDQQENLYVFMHEQGAEFGRLLNGLVWRELKPDVLLSNSGRCAAADSMGDQLKKQAERLRSIGHNDRNVEAYIGAAKSEMIWLGI